MHELSICRGLLAQVERAAEANGAHHVSRVTVRIGALSGVEPELLRRAFEVARQGGHARAAVLDIIEVPVSVRCEACGAMGVVTSGNLACPGCGNWRVELVAGDELLLESIELDAQDTVDAEEVA